MLKFIALIQQLGQLKNKQDVIKKAIQSSLQKYVITKDEYEILLNTLSNLN